MIAAQTRPAPGPQLVSVTSSPLTSSSSSSSSSSSASSSALVPCLAQRQEKVLALCGDDACDPGLPSFRAVLVHEVARLFDRIILPVVRPVWPGVENHPFMAKWRAGFELYCGLGLSTIVVSERRPVLVEGVSRAMRLLGVSEGGVVVAARPALPLIFRLFERRRCERVALAAAWILVLDEALDDGLPHHDDDARAQILIDIIHGRDVEGAIATVDGAEQGFGPEVRSAIAIAKALRASATTDDERASLAKVMHEVEGWVHGEMASVQGLPDPTGASHRMIGVTASMDLLLWGVDRYAGPLETEFLYRIAELGQMADDYLDIEKDRAQGRETPATRGFWTIADMERTYARAEALLHELADRAGERHGTFRHLLVRTFRGEVQRMGRTLVENP